MNCVRRAFLDLGVPRSGHRGQQHRPKNSSNEISAGDANPEWPDDRKAYNENGDKHSRHPDPTKRRFVQHGPQNRRIGNIGPPAAAHVRGREGEPKQTAEQRTDGGGKQDHLASAGNLFRFSMPIGV
jgi:hypothetical protein